MSALTLRSIVIVLCLTLAATDKFPRTMPGNVEILDKMQTDEEHYEDGSHNPDYDHDAFLGRDLAEEFEHMSPEESIKALSAIVDKMDKDEDGYVTEEELKNWITFTQRRYVSEDVDSQWMAHNPEGLEVLPRQTYFDKTYKFLEESDLENEEDIESYKEMKARDERRWDTADVDKDGGLSLDEFTKFLHPEDADHMKEIVVLETIEDVDKDKDGKISLEEYIGDMYQGESEAEEPEWVATERENFHKHRDTNSSGFMEKDEVRQWVLPESYDSAGAEAKHLIKEADLDYDGILSKEEIVSQYDLFVGSQATDFGEALKNHEEL